MVLALLLAAGVHFAEPLHADRVAVLAVKPGMTRRQVVGSLGALYDGAAPGQYDSCDAAISRMKNGGSVTYIAHWRIAYSWDRFWVGFDVNEVVVGTYLESTSR